MNADSIPSGKATVSPLKGKTMSTSADYDVGEFDDEPVCLQCWGDGPCPVCQGGGCEEPRTGLLSADYLKGLKDGQAILRPGEAGSRNPAYMETKLIYSLPRFRYEAGHYIEDPHGPIVRYADVMAAEISRAADEGYRTGRDREALKQIADWASAYPLDVFPEPDLKRAHEVLEAAGLSLGAISAHAMRHVLAGVQKIAAAASLPTTSKE